MVVQNRVVETRDSRGARGNSIIPDHTHPHTCIRNRMLVDGNGEQTPKIISFRKACNGHKQRICLTSRPVAVSHFMLDNILILHKKSENFNEQFLLKN